MTRWMLALSAVVVLSSLAAAADAQMLEDFSGQTKWRQVGPKDTQKDIFTFEVADAGDRDGHKAGKFTYTKDDGGKVNACWLSDKVVAGIKSAGKEFSGLSFRVKGDGSSEMGVIQVAAYDSKV